MSNSVNCLNVQQDLLKAEGLPIGPLQLDRKEMREVECIEGEGSAYWALVSWIYK